MVTQRRQQELWVIMGSNSFQLRIHTTFSLCDSLLRLGLSITRLVTPQAATPDCTVRREQLVLAPASYRRLSKVNLQSSEPAQAFSAPGEALRTSLPGQVKLNHSRHVAAAKGRHPTRPNGKGSVPQSS